MNALRQVRTVIAGWNKNRSSSYPVVQWTAVAEGPNVVVHADTATDHDKFATVAFVVTAEEATGRDLETLLKHRDREARDYRRPISLYAQDAPPDYIRMQVSAFPTF